MSVAVGLLAVCLAMSRYVHSARVRDWRWILTPPAEDAINAVAFEAEADATLASDAYGSAKRARNRGDGQEAARFLRLAFSVIEGSTPNKLSRLKHMAKCTKMALAILPLPAIQPRAFRLGRVSGVAGLAKLAHYILVSSAERFTLRLQVLMVGFRLVSRALRSSTETACGNPTATQAWKAFESGLSDWTTLDREHVEAFRALMMSLAAESRAGVIVRPA